MTKDEALTWLYNELSRLDERDSAIDMYRHMVNMTRAKTETDRRGLAAALHEWMLLRKEPETMLALEIGSAHNLVELRPEMEALLSDVRDGKAFRPYYEQYVMRALARMGESKGVSKGVSP